MPCALCGWSVKGKFNFIVPAFAFRQFLKKIKKNNVTFAFLRDPEVIPALNKEIIL